MIDLQQIQCLDRFTKDVGHIPQFSNFKKFQNQPPGFQPRPIKLSQVADFRW